MRKLIFLLIPFLLLSCKDDNLFYNGYIDADLTYLSSNYAGRLTDLLVSRGAHVHKNQLLFKLEQTNEKFDVEKSQLSKNNLLAQRKEIIDQIHYNDINYRRVLKMQQQHAASQNDVDLAKRDLDVSNSQLKAIDFQIQSSLVDTADFNWQITRKENYANQDGIIFDTYFTQGEYVQPGQPVLSFITRQHIKVIFYVPEQALSNISLNSKIKLSTDGNPSYGTGTIRYISNIAQYTPPVIYSREERQKLVFRVEASIDAPNLNQIHLGQPVSLEIIP